MLLRGVAYVSRSSAKEVQWWDVRWHSVPTLGRRERRRWPAKWEYSNAGAWMYALMKRTIVFPMMQIPEIAESLRPRWSWDVKEKKVRTSTPF